jgi:hypothetical protein
LEGGVFPGQAGERGYGSGQTSWLSLSIEAREVDGKYVIALKRLQEVKLTIGNQSPATILLFGEETVAFVRCTGHRTVSRD